MKKILLLSTFILMLGLSHAEGDGFCSIKNASFKNGENVSFYIFYTVVGIWIHAGTAQFTANLEQMNSKPVWHFLGSGQSNPNYDFIFKVRDRYESYVDTATMQPLKFIRSVQEGKYKKFENVTFNKTTNTAITNEGVYKMPACVQDVISEVYYARNIDFSKYKANDVINFDMFIDNEVHHMYMRYMGKEKVKTRYGKFNAIKVRPLLLKSSEFEGGEKMNVWLSDDANHIPVRIESPISVGSIKVDMMLYQNLRYPLTSLIGI